MQSVEAEALINARSSTVWDIITDAGNDTVWNSGITHITGEMRNGGTIRIRTRAGRNRIFRLRVEQVPGEVMTWSGSMRLGLFAGVRTFTLNSQDGMTHLRVKEEFARTLLGLPWKAMPEMQQTFTDYVDAVKERAEILDRHAQRPG